MGDSPDYCSATGSTIDASLDISLDDVPFPEKLEFENSSNDELAKTGCIYKGTSDAPGKLSCLTFETQCTDDLDKEDEVIECNNSLIYSPWAVPKVLCQWGPDDEQPGFLE